MSMSVPGNSCRPCNSFITPGCQFRLPGECVYYSGGSINPPGLNPGDTLNTLVIKLINYINSSVKFPPSIVPIKSSNFSVDGVTCNLPSMVGVNFEVFLNDINRFIYNEVGNQEWDYVAGGGFKILIPGFNANLSSYHLYLFPKV